MTDLDIYVCWIVASELHDIPSRGILFPTYEASNDLRDGVLNNWLVNITGELGKWIEGTEHGTNKQLGQTIPVTRMMRVKI